MGEVECAGSLLGAGFISREMRKGGLTCLGDGRGGVCIVV